MRTPAREATERSRLPHTSLASKDAEGRRTRRQAAVRAQVYHRTEGPSGRVGDVEVQLVTVGIRSWRFELAVLARRCPRGLSASLFLHATQP